MGGRGASKGHARASRAAQLLGGGGSATDDGLSDAEYKELEAYLKAKYPTAKDIEKALPGVKIVYTSSRNMKKAEQEMLARAGADVLPGLMDKYPVEGENRLKEFGVKNLVVAWGKDYDGAYAVFGDGKLNINSEYNLKQLTREYTQCKQTGWMSTGGVSGLISHEYGHTVGDHLIATGKMKEADMKKAFKSTKLSSQYAKTDHHEAWAESFAKIATGGKVEAGTFDAFVQEVLTKNYA